MVKGKTYGLHTIKNVTGPAHWALSLAVGCPHTFSVHRKDAFEWRLVQELFGLDCSAVFLMSTKTVDFFGR